MVPADPAGGGGGPFIRLDRVYMVHSVGDAGVVALGGVTLEVQRGEFAAIVGPSGAGKSTIMNLIGGVETATSGTVWVGDRDLTQLDTAERTEYRRRTVGFLWQGATKNLVPYLTTAQNVQLPLILGGSSTARSRRRAAELLELLDLVDRATHTPVMLSGGEQQQVAVAVALANAPSIVLADEPTAEIDTKGSERVIDALRAICREVGATVVMATHDLMAASRADTTYRLDDGRIRTLAGRGRIDARGHLRLPDTAVRVLGPSEVEVEIEADGLRVRRVQAEVAIQGVGPAIPSDAGRDGIETLRQSALTKPLRSTPATAGPRTDRPPVLSGTGIHRVYGRGATETRALRGVSVHVMAGELVVLMGPSGSGKSTLLGILGGFDEPDEGRVLWQGRLLTEIPGEEVARLHATNFGVVFQALGLFPWLSARENVVLPLLMAGIGPKNAAATADEWLGRLGLGERLEHRLNELSAGQQQRVAVARALATKPAIVLADEPTAEVDGRAAGLILGTLSEVTQRGGGVLVASHDPRVLHHADRVLMLRDGRMQAEGSPAEVAGIVTTD